VTVRRRWSPLFERHGVRLVLNGHDHNYQRFVPVRGVVHVVHGGGGARLYRWRRCAGLAAARSTHGFLYVRTDAAALTLSSVDLQGRVIDRVTLQAAGAVQAA
jgi:hypothetical protein